jgi:hypothetical protein
VKRRVWPILALLAITLAGVLLVLRQPGGSGPSVLSPGPAGWLAARDYLERRGARVTLLDRPLAVAPEKDSNKDNNAEDSNAEGSGSKGSGSSEGAGGEAATSLAAGEVLVTSFPWTGGLFQEEPAAYLEHAATGGTLIIAYSGGTAGLIERRFLSRLDLAPLRAQRKSPLGYGGWRQWRREIWELAPGDGLERQGAPPATPVPRLRPPQSVPHAPPEATVFRRAPTGVTAGAVDGPAAEWGSVQRSVDDALESQGYRAAGVLADGGPLVFAIPHGSGRVLLLPSDLFSNARLAQPGNVALLESVLAWAGPAWTFDEYHHGLRVPGEGPSPIPRRVLDLFLLHLLALYLLAIWHLARRFGAAWREPVAHSGSVASLLLGVGALHRELRHHAAAGELLLGRVRELERVQEDSALDRALRELPPATDDASLLALAAAAARARREHGTARLDLA